MPGIQTTTAETFGDRIKRRRRELRLTQRDVAAKLRIDFTYLSKLENNHGEPPSADTIKKLADVLRDDPQELLALAGKIPESLRDRAQRDVAFARLVQRLDQLSDKQLSDISRTLKITPPKK